MSAIVVICIFNLTLAEVDVLNHDTRIDQEVINDWLIAVILK